jgi:hypothetical protein
MPKLQTQPGDPKIVEEAGRLGAKAFADGKMCIPRHDAEFMKLIAGKQAGESIPYLDAWLKAFTKAVVDDAFVFEIE